MAAQIRSCLALAILLALPSVVGAQQTHDPGSARVTLIAGPSPSRGGRTEVVRHANRAPQNVIIVDRNATAEDLAAALAMFNALRAQFGDSLDADIRARPDKVRLSDTWQRSTYRTWLINQLARLRRAPTVAVPHLGMARAVQITVPAPKGTFAQGGAVTK